MGQVMEKIEKSCKTCGYFLQYYVNEEGEYKAIACGHCKRCVVTSKTVGFPFEKGCSLWRSKQNNPPAEV